MDINVPDNMSDQDLRELVARLEKVSADQQQIIDELTSLVEAQN